MQVLAWICTLVTRDCAHFPPLCMPDFCACFFMTLLSRDCWAAGALSSCSCNLFPCLPPPLLAEIRLLLLLPYIRIRRRKTDNLCIFEKLRYFSLTKYFGLCLDELLSCSAHIAYQKRAPLRVSFAYL